MIEKFSDFESAKYLDKAGTFVFTVKNYELKESKTGNPMAVFTVEAAEGTSTLYFPIIDSCKWKYNMFIKACLYEKLNTPEKVASFTLDYDTIGRELIGKKFTGTVDEDSMLHVRLLSATYPGLTYIVVYYRSLDGSDYLYDYGSKLSYKCPLSVALRLWEYLA